VCSGVHAGAQPSRDLLRKQIEAGIAKRFVPARRERNPTGIPVAETLLQERMAPYGVLAKPMGQELLDEGFDSFAHLSGV
jgi:hypothetical protein